MDKISKGHLEQLLQHSGNLIIADSVSSVMYRVACVAIGEGVAVG